MGYTHYWMRDKMNLGSAYYFHKLSQDAQKIIAQAETEGIIIRGPLGNGAPEFTDDYFALNGDEAEGLDHETFVWHRAPEQPEWFTEKYGKDPKRKNDITDFCKTAHKPYDAVVTAILIRAKTIYGNCVDIESDGNWEMWQAGRDLYERALGETAPEPFTYEVANA